MNRVQSRPLYGQVQDGSRNRMVANYLATARASWSCTVGDLAAFLRNPRLVSPSDITTRSKVVTTLWLYVLSMLATLAFALAALPFFLISEPSMSGGLSNVLDRPVMNTIIALVVLGPLIEEVIFRGWLNGTWQSLIGTAVFILMFYNGPTVVKDFIDIPLLNLQIGFSAIGIAIMFSLAATQEVTSIIGFERLFPLIFWGQGIVFGALHFQNIYSDALALPLLMTFTLVICGWLWGYARVVLGLPAAVFLHMAYNVPSAVGMLAFMAIAS